MDLTTISTQRSCVFALVAALVSITAPGFTSEKPMISPPLTIRPGTILNIRISQPLSSDRSQAGDVFSGTLTQPVIVNGIVVAQRGQPVTGRVVEVKKAGRFSGVSRLGIAVTNLTAVDGQTVSIESQLLVHQGPTSVGRDSAAVAGATGLGAAIGAAAEGGTGAAIGAGIGAAASTIGVLLTRGRATVIDPETLLTFQVTAPATITTNDAPQAFRFVERADYAEPERQSPQLVMPHASHAPVYLYTYPYYGPLFSPYYYPYYPFPYYYGPSVRVFFGYSGGYGYPGFRHGYYPHRYPSAGVTFRGNALGYRVHNGNHR
ncbi:MAG TPA: hypothetical protein VG498_16975 [Terriglobales bacterium]|nr:hypothetical protein [Terriglobales bacterium]